QDAKQGVQNDISAHHCKHRGPHGCPEQEPSRPDCKIRMQQANQKRYAECDDHLDGKTFHDFIFGKSKFPQNTVSVLFILTLSILFEVEIDQVCYEDGKSDE